jgi:hypothetical protein
VKQMSYIGSSILSILDFCVTLKKADSHVFLYDL